jgi:hypothetical protein
MRRAYWNGFVEGINENSAPEFAEWKKQRQPPPMTGSFLHPTINADTFSNVLDFLALKEIGRLCFVANPAREQGVRGSSLLRLEPIHEAAYHGMCRAISRDALLANYIPPLPAVGRSWQQHFDEFYPVSRFEATKASWRAACADFLDPAVVREEKRAALPLQDMRQLDLHLLLACARDGLGDEQQMRAVARLLNQGAWHPDDESWTPLHSACACSMPMPETVKLLVAAGADVNRSLHHTLPLQLALNRKFFELANMLGRIGGMDAAQYGAACAREYAAASVLELKGQPAGSPGADQMGMYVICAQGMLKKNWLRNNKYVWRKADGSDQYIFFATTARQTTDTLGFEKLKRGEWMIGDYRDAEKAEAVGWWAMEARMRLRLVILDPTAINVIAISVLHTNLCPHDCIFPCSAGGIAQSHAEFPMSTDGCWTVDGGPDGGGWQSVPGVSLVCHPDLSIGDVEPDSVARARMWEMPMLMLIGD